MVKGDSLGIELCPLTLEEELPEVVRFLRCMAMSVYRIGFCRVIGMMLICPENGGEEASC
jgi:hypothetical protein